MTIYTIRSWRRIILLYLLVIAIIIYFLCKHSQFPERDTMRRRSVYVPDFLFLYDYYGIPFRFQCIVGVSRPNGRP